MICGVDEAGKGSVLGPMVVAAVGCRGFEELSDLSIRDSKVLRPGQREELYETLTRDFSISVVTIDAAGIDEARSRMSMNTCVAELHAGAIAKLRPKSAYVDACDVNAERYGRTVAGFLDFPCEVIAEHRADARYTIVGAASIVAKVTRDRAIRELEGQYGTIGSGYPSDPTTIKFLRTYIKNHGNPPPCARRGRTVGIARADVPNPGLLDAITKAGGTIREERVYALVPTGTELALDTADAVIFTSAMSYREARWQPRDDLLIVAIGDVTADAMRAGGNPPVVVGDGSLAGTLDALNHHMERA